MSRKSSSQGVLKRSSQANSPRKVYFTLEPKCPALRDFFEREVAEVLERKTGQVLFRVDGTPSVEVIKALVENSDSIFEFRKRIVAKAIAEIDHHRKDGQEQIPTEDLVLIVGATLHEFFNPRIPLPAPLVMLVKELNEVLQGKKFTAEEIHAILGVPVFLRCINPALGTPEKFGVKADEYTRKTLVQVAKALQLMTNQATPDDQHTCFPIRDQLKSLQSATMHAIDAFLKTQIAGPLEVADVAIGETTLKKMLSPPELVLDLDDTDGRSSPYPCATFQSQ